MKVELDMKIQWSAALGLAFAASVAQAGSSQPFELEGTVSYSDVKADQFLLAYTSNEVDDGPVVYGRALASDGSAMSKGMDIRLSTLDGKDSKPAIGYSATTQRYLVTWGRKLITEKRSEINGVVMGLNGQIITQEFHISFSDIYDQRPAVAYCPGRNVFLVAWTRGTSYDFNHGISDIYGQFVSSDGSTLVGSNFVIASAPKNQFKPDVTCDEVHDNFMVVWEDQRNDATQDDIYGQLISSDGTMIGDNFLISGTPNIERRPVVAANSVGNYLVVWESDSATSADLYSQLLDPTGKLMGQPALVGDGLGGTRDRPAVAYLKRQDVFLTVWHNSNFGQTSDGIYGQMFESNGKLRQGWFPVTTATLVQDRPNVSAARDAFLSVWTDYRDTANTTGKHTVYEYYGRLIGNDMPLSQRWRNPESR
jgi:hypothetical protein